MPFTPKAKILGLEIGTRGVVSHMKKRLTLAKQQYLKLKRFKRMNPKIKIHFYKTLIRPIMEYPVVPLCITSKTNMKRIQQFQNRVLRESTRGTVEDNNLTIEELHTKYKIEAVNGRLHRLASKTWEQLRRTNEDLVTESEEQDNIPIIEDHYWWRRISPYVNGRNPLPNYATAG